MNIPKESDVRRMALQHLLLCFGAFGLFEIGRYITIFKAPESAIFLPQFTTTFISDFITTVVILGVLRAFYAIPILLVRKSLARVYDYLLFGLVFAVIFSNRSDSAIGISVQSPGKVLIYYTFPRSIQKFDVTTPDAFIIRDTGAVSVLESSWKDIAFKPVFNFDNASIQILNDILEILNANRVALTDG